MNFFNKICEKKEVRVGIGVGVWHRFRVVEVVVGIGFRVGLALG